MFSQFEIVSSKNRRTMHSPYGAYADLDAAKTMGASPYKLCLNGEWSYSVFPCPEAVPADWAGADFSDFAKMPVPSCWELHGIGKPVYTNVIYPFNREDKSYEIAVTDELCDLSAPLIPKENLTVCFYRTFTLPRGWNGRRLYLNFGGVETAFHLAVNGCEFGFSEDSKLPSEFDVTELIHPGENTLAVKVYRYSPQSYLEDQDYWHVHGIYRDVTLISKAPLHIEDFKLEPIFGDTLENAELGIKIWPDNTVPYFGSCRVRVSLFDRDGNLFAAHTTARFADHTRYLEARYVINEKFSLPAPRLWDCEDPYLYTAVLEMLDGEGNVTDVESARVGFREIRIKNGIMELNRKRLIVRGADLHEFSPYTGRAVSPRELRAQLLAAKALNLNAIRTCHYPKNDLFYDYCDELGIYVTDEANLETHGYDGTLSDDPRWADAYVQRAMRMCLRDKNHPCVITWSLGNESGSGANHSAMAGWLRHYDSRPVQIECINSPAHISDINAPMYPTFERIEELMADTADLRPLIMCEYAYSKSNSNGNFKLFWDYVRKYPRFQGGFIWDFVDKALVRFDGGKPTFRYAGAFGEDVADPVADMCLNGVVFADLEPKPGAWEIKYCQSPIYVTEDVFRGIYSGKILVNEHARLSTEAYRLTWELVCNGKTVEQGELENICVAPGQRKKLNIPYSREKVFGEAFITFRVLRRTATEFAPAGDTVYLTQWEAEGSAAYLSPDGPCSKEALTVYESENSYTVSGEELILKFSKATGGISLCIVGGKPLFRNTSPELFRAPTGIDETANSNSTLTDWSESGLIAPNWKLENLSVFACGSTVYAEEKLTCLGGRIVLSRSYAVTAGGVRITTRLTNGLQIETLARIGHSSLLPGEYSNLEWYGRGPHESYSDRKESAVFGIYQSNVSAQHANFVRPCECGGHEDTRWLRVTNGEGHGLEVRGSGFHFSALPWSIQQYTAANYADELGTSLGTNLVLDGFSAGLGGDTGWDKVIHPEYRIPKGSYIYELELRWI